MLPRCLPPAYQLLMRNSGFDPIESGYFHDRFPDLLLTRNRWFNWTASGFPYDDPPARYLLLTRTWSYGPAECNFAPVPSGSLQPLANENLMG